MPSIDRAADNHTNAGTPDHPGAAVGEFDRSDQYLTDEVFLFRVVSDVAGEMVYLEDCYGLDVVRVPVTRVRERRLRAVNPAPAER